MPQASWSGVATVERLAREDSTSCKGYGGEPDPLHELSQSEDLHAGRRPLPQEQDRDWGTEEGEVFNPGLDCELSRLEPN